MALHCPECGFGNPEGANYCQKCGAYLARTEGGEASRRRRPTRSTRPASTSRSTSTGGRAAGAALVIRSGGGRSGESFTVNGDRVGIGRSPDAGVFLDDVPSRATTR